MSNDQTVNDSDASKIDTNKALARSLFGYLYAGDLDEAKGLLTDDFTHIVAVEDDELEAVIPWAGHTFHGPEGFAEFAGWLFGDDEFESLRFDVQDIYAEDDTVVAFGHFDFEHRLTGRVAHSDFCARFTARDGMIAMSHFFENTYGVAAARPTDARTESSGDVSSA